MCGERCLHSRVFVEWCNLFLLPVLASNAHGAVSAVVQTKQSQNRCEKPVCCSHMCPRHTGELLSLAKSVSVILLLISLRYLMMCVSENILQVLTLIACIHMLNCGLLMHSRESHQSM